MENNGFFSWSHRNSNMFSWLIVFVFFLGVHYTKNITLFPYDAGNYWGLSSLPTLFDFPPAIRGYFFPLLLSPVRFLYDRIPEWGLHPYRIFTACFYSFVLTIVLPLLFHRFFGGEDSFWRRLIVPVLLGLFLPGIIIYPLSDLPAFCFLLLAIWSAEKALSLYNYRWNFNIILYCLLSGFFLYGAINTRTIYWISLIVWSIGFLVTKKVSGKNKLMAILLFCIGMSISATPQMLINQKNYGELSPDVYNKEWFPNGMFALNLWFGLSIQRYETSTFDKNPGVIFRDHAMSPKYEMWRANGHTGERLRDYFYFIIKHPLDFLGICGRHIVNGFDLRYGEVYLTAPRQLRDGLAFVNFLFLYASCAVLFMTMAAHPPRGEKSRASVFWAFVILMPVAAVIPGSSECRYYLPALVAIYSALAFFSNVPQLLRSVQKNWLLWVLSFGLSSTIYFGISTMTMASIPTL